MSAEEYKELTALLNEYSDFGDTAPLVAEFINKLVEAEREACAKIVKDLFPQEPDVEDLRTYIYNAIRERGAP